jgi:hypothetical protein
MAPSHPHCSLTFSSLRAGLFLGSLPVCVYSLCWAGVQGTYQALGWEGVPGAWLSLIPLPPQLGSRWNNSWMVAQPVRVVQGLCNMWRGPLIPGYKVSPHTLHSQGVFP